MIVSDRSSLLPKLKAYNACLTDGQSVKSAGKAPALTHGYGKKSTARSGTFSLTL
jgi:hypothetical protein